MLSSAPARTLYLFNTGYLPLNYSGNSGVNGESYRGLGTLHLVVQLETAVWQQALDGLKHSLFVLSVVRVGLLDHTRTWPAVFSA